MVVVYYSVYYTPESYRIECVKREKNCGMKAGKSFDNKKRRTGLLFFVREEEKRIYRE